MKRKLTIFVYCMCISTLAYAQHVTVSGTVMDETGEPLPGVNILQKGTALARSRT